METYVATLRGWTAKYSMRLPLGTRELRRDTDVGAVGTYQPLI